MAKMKHSRPNYDTPECDVEMDESLYENITVSVFTLDIKYLLTKYTQHNSVFMIK